MANNPTAKGLSAQTVEGVAWNSVVLLLSRVLGVASQVVLAFYLDSLEFGAAALAMSLTSFGGIVQSAGLREVLLPRKKLEKWEDDATWISISLSFVSLSIVAIIALACSPWLSSPVLWMLVAALCIQFPINAIGMVPSIRLQRKLAFRRLSMIELACRVFQAGTTIVLAIAGFKAFSLVLPIPLTQLLRTMLLCRGQRAFPRRAPRIRRWKYLFRSNLAVLIGNASMLVTRQADYLILGFFAGPSVLGYYYFAYNLTMGIIQLFNSTVVDTIFVSLTRLAHDLPRQTEAFLRASRILLALGIPLCVAQFVLAEELITAVWADRWVPSIIYVQVLSLGLSGRLIAPPAYRFIQASKQYSMYMWTAVFNMFTFLLFTIIAGTFYGGVGIAIAVSVHAATLGLICLWVACQRNWGNLVKSIMPLYFMPFTASAATLLFVKWVLSPFSDTLWTLFLIPIACVPIYVGIYRLVQVDTFNDIRSQLESLARSILRRRAVR